MAIASSAGSSGCTSTPASPSVSAAGPTSTPTTARPDIIASISRYGGSAGPGTCATTCPTVYRSRGSAGSGCSRMARPSPVRSICSAQWSSCAAVTPTRCSTVPGIAAATCSNAASSGVSPLSGPPLPAHTTAGSVLRLGGARVFRRVHARRHLHQPVGLRAVPQRPAVVVRAERRDQPGLGVPGAGDRGPEPAQHRAHRRRQPLLGRLVPGHRRAGLGEQQRHPGPPAPGQRGEQRRRAAHAVHQVGVGQLARSSAPRACLSSVAAVRASRVPSRGSGSWSASVVTFPVRHAPSAARRRAAPGPVGAGRRRPSSASCRSPCREQVVGVLGVAEQASAEQVGRALRRPRRGRRGGARSVRRRGRRRRRGPSRR